MTPFEVPPFSSVDPLPVYRLWWDQVERCVGARGDFARIEWFVGDPTSPDGDPLTGQWSAPRFIVLRAFYLTSEPAVKHEMLHHLSQGDMPHSDPAFVRCTRTVGANVVITIGGGR